MYPFIETIRIEDGQIYNLDYHTERLIKPVQLFGKTALRWIYGNLYLRQL